MNLANIPDEMIARSNWCVWRLEQIGGRETKIPYNPRTGVKAKSNDFATWCKFADAVAAVRRGGYNGVGFMLSDSPYVCVDLDHCLDGGEKEEWARGIVEQIGGYVEVSQSGHGLHIFGRATVERGRRNDRIEIYPDKRFIAMTGDVWEGHGALSEIQAGINALMAEHFATSGETAGFYSKTRKTQTKHPHGGGAQQGAAAQSGADRDGHAPNRPPHVDAVIAKMRKGERAELFAALFDRGDTSPYGSGSEADMALMNMIAFAADGDAALMEEVFTCSALGRREKWQTRADYRKMTVGTARVGWRENRLAFLPLTDTDNAERLRLLYGDDLKYLLERGTGKGATWARWDGKRWERIHEIGLYDLVAETARLSLAAVEKYLFHVEDDRIRKGAKERINYLMKLKNYGKMDACLKIARNFFQASVNDFDAEPFILNVQNGIVDLKTGVLYPHDRAAMCTRITRAEYRPELIGKESLWARTVAQIIPDEEERTYLQKWAGYLLTGSTREEKFLFLYGRGGSGKGTFINTIARMLGDYADTVDIEVFLSSRNDGHGGGANASPEIAKLAGIRTATANETPIGRRMNEAKIKTMTGRDDITARFLYGQQFTFSPAVKFVLSSNYVPAVHDASDEGIRRRLVIAPFMQDYGEDRDDTLKDHLHTKEEFAACLAWCVDGCLKWQKEGLGKPPRRFLQQMGMFYADSDTLQQFIDEMCITGDGGGKPLRVPVKQMLRAYADWSGDEIKRATMVNLMRRKGYDVHSFNIGQCFLKIALKGWFH
ncbi:MAG: phage/plasmid primase, P4 family [Selenomonas massiliensis]